MMTTLRKASITATKKALVSDFNNRAKPSFICDQGDDKAVASSKSAPITTTQSEIGPLKADNSQPKILYVTSSSVRESQGRFLKVGMQ
jgi:hypothetical protein